MSGPTYIFTTYFKTEVIKFSWHAKKYWIFVQLAVLLAARSGCYWQTVPPQWGKTFRRVGRFLFYENGRNSETKSWNSIPRCEMDRLSEGYKRAIDKICGPIAKNGVFVQSPSFPAPKKSLLLKGSLRARKVQFFKHCSKSRWPPHLFEHYVVNFSEGILTSVCKRLSQKLSTK